jgi:hypothetical protein
MEHRSTQDQGIAHREKPRANESTVHILRLQMIMLEQENVVLASGLSAARRRVIELESGLQQQESEASESSCSSTAQQDQLSGKDEDLQLQVAQMVEELLEEELQGGGQLRKQQEREETLERQVKELEDVIVGQEKELQKRKECAQEYRQSREALVQDSEVTARRQKLHDQAVVAARLNRAHAAQVNRLKDHITAQEEELREQGVELREQGEELEGQWDELRVMELENTRLKEQVKQQHQSQQRQRQ